MSKLVKLLKVIEYIKEFSPKRNFTSNKNLQRNKKKKKNVQRLQILYYPQQKNCLKITHMQVFIPSFVPSHAPHPPHLHNPINPCPAHLILLRLPESDNIGQKYRVRDGYSGARVSSMKSWPDSFCGSHTLPWERDSCCKRKIENYPGLHFFTDSTLWAGSVAMSVCM